MGLPRVSGVRGKLLLDTAELVVNLSRNAAKEKIFAHFFLDVASAQSWD